jgi:CheY-like chemotaxis protein
MLTSCCHCGDAKLLREIGFSAYLSKPVRPSQLYDCLRLVLAAPSTSTAERGKPLLTRHSVVEIKKHNTRILLAEDNPVNARLVIRILEKAGYPAGRAVNGREVLAALDKIRYDLVLMDVQMPEMDGLETTRAIRQKELLSGKHVPIIALTAHAIKGDQQICLDAGLDDYLSKPIRPKLLIFTVERVLRQEKETMA